jgi:hypothetical protein
MPPAPPPQHSTANATLQPAFQPTFGTVTTLNPSRDTISNSPTICSTTFSPKFTTIITALRAAIVPAKLTTIITALYPTLRPGSIHATVHAANSTTEHTTIIAPILATRCTTTDAAIRSTIYASS